MTISKETFEKIKARASIICIDSDVEDAFDFVLSVISAEIDALNEKCPYATTTIKECEMAEYIVQRLQWDAGDEAFDEI